MPKRYLFVGILLISFQFLGAGKIGSTFESDISRDNLTGMGNPAAVYCQELGYQFKTIVDNKGEYGVCIFPEGQECDAWEFLQGDCGQDHSYCAHHGLVLVVKKDGNKGLTRSYAVCVDEKHQEVGKPADMMELEQKSLGCGVDLEETRMPELARAEPAQPLDFTPPVSFSWYDEYNPSNDWLSPVKNQGICGSCWAFSAVGVAESVINIAQGDPTYDLNLSEQYLVTDCHMVSGYQTCCGGWKDDALAYIRDSGIPDDGCLPYVDGTGCTCRDGTCDDTDNQYPYTRECNYRTGGECSDQECSDRCGDWSSRLVNIQSYGGLGFNAADSTIKQYLINFGPLAVSVGIGSTVGGGFGGDDIYECSSTDTNHAVAIVGYEDVGESGYWIIRNSWGSGWNGNGYYKLAYGECGVNRYVYYASDNQPPNQPVSPSPGDAAWNVSFTSDLSWLGGDPNPGDTITYDVFLEANDPSPDILVCDNAATELCDPGVLLESTTYYWQVGATDSYNETSTSQIWSFTPVSALANTAGLYDPATSGWFLKPENVGGKAGVVEFYYGPAGGGRLPISGDWDGDGVDTVGLYDPATSRWFLKPENVDGGAGVIKFYYGPAGGGRLPIAGDWDGNGTDTVGLYDPATSRWFLKPDNLDGGAGVVKFYYGPAGGGRLPIAGDWDGDGVDTVGLYDPVTSRWFLKPESINGGDGVVKFYYGPAGGGRIPISGDWDGDITDTVGMYDPATSRWFLKPDSVDGGTGVIKFYYGPAGGGRLPIAGNW